ncbi:MAG: LysR family transcriptional regulator [Alphaproteobacteria bacterium]|nr:LysR family transcriptional regulator [Alphaproteobacteria bacterium]
MDLNLFPVFIEIMRHGSVSKAADQLGLTQSATSNALSRLRHQMGDPLFVRSKKGMLPTHFAREKLAEIEAAVDCLKSMQVNQQEKLPKLRDIKRHFKYVASDLETALYLTDLVEHLSVAAPNITLEITPYRSDRVRKDLEDEKLDFALAFMRDPVKNIISQPLAHQEFATLSRKNHPALETGLSLDLYCQLKHILVTPDKGGTKGVVDTQLSKLGYKRDVFCTIPHFLSGCMLVSQTDYLLTVPKRLGEKVAEQFNLSIHELPFKMPGFTIGIHWHWVRNSDPEHKVFRQEVLRLFRDNNL